MWPWKKKQSRPVNLFEGSKIEIGSFVDAGNGKQFVSFSCTGNSGVLTPGGARIIAQQLTQWADEADKNNALQPSPFVNPAPNEREMIINWIVNAIDETREAAEARQ